jgi:7-carboxy-7-deazaguanine synthase
MTLPLAVIEESAAERVRALRERTDVMNLLVHEIYVSIQGEGTHVGVPCVFVRLTGCHLRCRYCDTAHAFHEGTEYSVDEVFHRVRAYQIPLVLLTGGEPLLQKASADLMRRLCDAGNEVLLETSGGVSTAAVDPRVRVILDIKTPGSSEAARNVTSNLQRLQPHDEVKFVLCDENDYGFAKDWLLRTQLHERCTVLFSPAAGRLSPRWLAEQIVADRLPVRFQLQLHKVLWGDERGV